jgi:hypothetical protein
LSASTSLPACWAKRGDQAGGQCAALGLRAGQIALGGQQRLHRVERAMALRHVLEQLRQGGQQRGALHRVGRQLQPVEQGLGRVLEAPQGNRQTHHMLLRGQGAELAAPVARGAQGLAAGAGLQRQVDGAPVQAFVAGAARGVQQHLVGGAEFAALRLHLADQQLIEEGGVEARIGCGRLVLRERRGR